MRNFSKKSVALVLFVTVFFAFLSFSSVSALTAEGTPITNNAAATQISSASSTIDSSNPWYTFILHPIDSAAKLAADVTFELWEKVLDLLLTIANLVLYVAGGLFDISVKYSLFQFKSLFDQSSSAIDSLWKLIRDTTNIFFIFMMLYTAIQMIIGNAGIKAKTAFMNIIISAILVNFSMFITKILIDFGNIFATAFYNRIAPGDAGISGIILKNLNLLSLFSVSNFSSSVTSHANLIMSLIVSIVLVCVMAYAYFFAAYVFLGRAAMLILLAIASPIGFVGSTIPGLKKESEDWWKELNHQILVAPVFLLFMLIITSITSSPILKNSIDIANTNARLNIAGIFYYFVVMKILFVAIKKTKDLSGEIGEVAIKAFKGAATIAAISATGGIAAGAGLAEATGLAGRAGALGTSLFESEAARRVAGRVPLLGEATRSVLAGASRGIGNAPGVVLGKIGKTITGDIEKEPGYIARGLSATRGAINAGIKTGTAGTLDLMGIQKALKKATEENEKKIIQAAEKAGPQKAEERLQQLENIRGNIKGQAERRLIGEESRLEKEVADAKAAFANLPKAVSPQDSAKAQDNLNKAEAALTKYKDNQTEKRRLQSEAENSQKAVDDLNLDRRASKEQKIAARTNLDAATKALDEFKKAELKEQEEVIAKELGVLEGKDKEGKSSFLATLEKEMGDTRAKIVEGDIKRNKFIVETETKKAEKAIMGREYFGILQNKEDRKKVIEKLRAQKGKFNDKDLKKAIKEFSKNMGIEEEEKKGGEGGKKEGGEEKPKEGGSENK